MKKVGIGAVIGLLLLAWLVTSKPFGESKPGSFSQVLYAWSDSQQQVSEEMTDKAVASVEGVYVPEHEEDGRNWSIPNIIRHLLGVRQ